MDATDWVAIYGALVATILGVLQFADWRASRTFLSHSLVQTIEGDLELVVLTVRNRGNRPTTIEMIGAGKFGQSKIAPWRSTPLCVVSMRSAEDNFGNGLGEPLGEFVLQPGHQVYAALSKQEFEDGMFLDWTPQGSRVRSGVLIEHSQSDKPVCEWFEWLES